MPILVRIDGDIAGVKARLEALGPKKMGMAIMRALNRTADSARTQAIRSITADLGDIRQKRVRDQLWVAYARPEDLTATVYVEGLGQKGVIAAKSRAEAAGRIPLYEFHPSPSRPGKRRPGGVRYRLPGGRSVVPTGFIAEMDSGHVGVFQRIPGTQMTKSKYLRGARGMRNVKREMIRELYGPSIPKSFGQRAVLDAVRKKAKAELSKNIAQQVEYLSRQQR